MSVDFIVGILITGLAVVAAAVSVLLVELKGRVTALEGQLAKVSEGVKYCREIVDMPSDMHDATRDQILRDAHRENR